MKFTIIWTNFDTTGNEINIPYNNIAEFGSEINNPLENQPPVYTRHVQIWEPGC